MVACVDGQVEVVGVHALGVVRFGVVADGRVGIVVIAVVVADAVFPAEVEQAEFGVQIHGVGKVQFGTCGDVESVSSAMVGEVEAVGVEAVHSGGDAPAEVDVLVVLCRQRQQGHEGREAEDAPKQMHCFHNCTLLD